MTSVRGGRQDFRGTRGLIGRADGNALKVRSAWGIDRRPGPVPRWELCWRSFISLRAICCEWREEYKEGERERERARQRQCMHKGWLSMFSVIYWLTTSLLLFQIIVSPYSQTTAWKIIRPHCVRQFPEHEALKTLCSLGHSLFLPSSLSFFLSFFLWLLGAISGQIWNSMAGCNAIPRSLLWWFHNTSHLKSSDSNDFHMTTVGPYNSHVTSTTLMCHQCVNESQRFKWLLMHHEWVVKCSQQVASYI